MRRYRRLLYALVVCLAFFVITEAGAHLAFGEPPTGELIQRIGQCRVVATGIDCPMDPTISVVVPPRDARPRVVFLGGSTVRVNVQPPTDANFPAWIAELAPDLDVVNLGVPGYSTAGVWNLARQLDAFRPDLVVVMTGHNDYNQSVFDGTIRAASLWTVRVEQVLAHSWIRSWMRPLRTLRPPGEVRPLLPIGDDFAVRNASRTDARFRAELTEAVRASPAPVVLTTLLRNFDTAPTGVLTAGHPGCAAVLTIPGVIDRRSPVREWLDLVSPECDGTSIVAFLQAHLAADAARRAASWREALRLDAAPLRAPLSADDVIRDVAAREGATLVDLAALSDGYQPGEWFTDPLHTNRAGAEAAARAVLPAVRAALAAAARP